MADDVLYQVDRERVAGAGPEAVLWGAKYGNMATLEKALKYGLNIHGQLSDSVQDFYCSPLHLAVMNGQDLAVAWFLDHDHHGADLTQPVHCPCPELKSGGCKSSILHTAICYNKTSTARLLISRKAPLAYRRRYLLAAPSVGLVTDALLEASAHGMVDLVEELVGYHGLKLHLSYDRVWGDVLCCAITSKNSLLTVKALLRLGANVDGSYDGNARMWNVRPLHVALARGDFQVANILLDAGARLTPYVDEISPAEHCTPLHDTLNSISIGRVYGSPKSWGSDEWLTARTAMMSRLIALGVDVNAKDDHDATPMDLAIDWGNLNDMAALVKAGAEVKSRMLHIAYEDMSSGRNNTMKFLLAQGLRLDEPLEESLRTTWWDMEEGWSMLELAADQGEPEHLHELLVLSSPKTLTSTHLDQVFESNLIKCNEFACDVLFRHGARIFCRNKLFSISWGLIQNPSYEGRGQEGTRLLLTDFTNGETGSDRLRIPISFLLDMGMRRSHQCILFREVLRKRQTALAHLFLDRDLAQSGEAAERMSVFLGFAADWGDTTIIKRLWRSRHMPSALASTHRLLQLLLQRAVLHGNADAVTFFLDNGASPSQRVISVWAGGQEQVALWLHAHQMANVWNVVRAYKENWTTGLYLTELDVSDSELMLLPLQLAVRHGHANIISHLLSCLTRAEQEAVVYGPGMHIPCVLAKANEIRALLLEVNYTGSVN